MLFISICICFLFCKGQAAFIVNDNNLTTLATFTGLAPNGTGHILLYMNGQAGTEMSTATFIKIYRTN
jgi:hypothetical protein